MSYYCSESNDVAQHKTRTFKDYNALTSLELDILQ